MRVGGNRDDGLFSGLQWRRGILTAAITVWSVNAIGLLVGVLAKSLQGAVDEPFFDRVARAGNTPWTDRLETVTRMGNVPQTQLWTFVFAVTLATWFASRGWRWWVPLLVCPAAWVVEKLSQSFLAKIIDRERDLISLIGTPIGNFPSGGCARLIVVTGTAAYLVVHYARTTRRTTTVLFTLVGVLGLVEAYCRARLNQHWLTDIVGGVVIGWLLLGAVILTLRAFDPDPSRFRRADRAPEHRSPLDV